jgi:hypothetical protein
LHLPQSIADFQIWVGGQNVAYNKTAYMSSQFAAHAAGGAIDGDNSTLAHSNTITNSWCVR